VTVGSAAALALVRQVACGATALALFATATTVGCGGRSQSSAAGSTSVGGSEASGGAPATEDYVGVVLATVMSDGEGKTYSSTAAFSQGGNGVRLDACSTCCCYHSIGLALPRQPPNAATIVLTTTESDHALVSLVPSSNHLRKSWVLNQWGVVGASDYELVNSEPWAPGQTLRVTADGNAIHAFAGEIRAGAGFDGLAPDILSQGMVLDRTRDFNLTWLPEDEDEWITLTVQQIGGDDGFCICSAPDSAGTLTLARDEVEKFGVGSGHYELVRSITARAPSDNASVTLVSQVGVTGGVGFR